MPRQTPAFSHYSTGTSALRLPSLKELTAEHPVAPMPEDRTFSIVPAVAPARKLKAAAYCRVSTGEQESSIDIQRKHFSSLAAQHDDWQFQGLYCDIISGTKKEKRPELNRLLADCEVGNINLVLVKSVSRFARNTTDLLQMVRSLTALGVDIIFDREHLDTRLMGSEFLLTVLASLAENESHSFSANCRWGLQERFRTGTYRAANAPYGYDLVDGGFEVNQKEAAVVKEIFQKTMKGVPMRQIAEDLVGRGIPTKRAGEVWNGKEVSGKWTAYTIRQILKNSAYIGNMELQKTYNDQTFRRCVNRGELPMYYMEGHHEAIISRADFDLVQGIMEGRKTGQIGVRKTHTLTGKLVCNACGSPLIRQTNRVGTVSWVCGRHRKKASECAMPPVKEETLWMAFAETFRKLTEDDGPIRVYMDGLKLESEGNRADEKELLEKRLSELEQELRNLAARCSRPDQGKANILIRQNELKSEQTEIRAQLARMEDKRISQTKELLQVLHSRGGSFISRDGDDNGRSGGSQEIKDLFKAVVDSVTVYGKKRFAFHLIGGFTEMYQLVAATGTQESLRAE